MPQHMVFRIGGDEGAWRLIVPLFVTNGKGNSVESYALLDGGSTRHVVSRDIAKRLGIEGRKVRMCVTTLDHSVESEREVATVSVVGLNGVEVALTNAIFGDIIASHDDRPPKGSDIEGMDHLEGVQFPAFPSGSSDGEGPKIGVIIGAEHARLWTLGERRDGGDALPVGVATDLGWALLGPKVSSAAHCFSCNHASFSNLDPDVSGDLQAFFARGFEKVDEGAEAWSLEDKYAIRQLEETIRWDDEVKRYRVGLMYPEGREAAARKLNAVDSDSMALDRLRRTGRQMLRDPERCRITFETMAKFVEGGRVVEVDLEAHRNHPPDRPRWTIPIHVADKPGKPGQVRVCHDCKAKAGGICLNDFLLDGPALACDIRGVIMRFRDGGEVAVGADVKDFFHEVYIDERDAGAFRYFWFKDATMRQIILNGFLGHVFGARSSSCVSTFTLRHHISRPDLDYDLLVREAVIRNMYVDDMVKSLRGVTVASRFCVGSTAALKDGGFTLCKWKSSHPAALEGLEDGAKAANGVPNDAPGAPAEMGKILGMKYSFETDSFYFLPDSERVGLSVRNKRQMLKVIASFYDPMGFLDPLIINARKIFQRAVKAVAGWNDKDLLPSDIAEAFADWQQQIPLISGLVITRWTATPATQWASPELHMFGDASPEAFGASGYIRREAPDGSIHVAIVCAKAHVVPLKDAMAGHNDSMPRLELQAARLAARMRAGIERESDGFGRVVMWTDSECVIKQLNDVVTRFKIYFANRLSEIQVLTRVDEWRYVPSAENPADDCSRGLAASDPKWHRFHHGPDFLWQQEAFWPSKVVASKPFPAHILATSVVAAASPPWDWVLALAAVTSDWMLLLRRVAWVRRSLRLWVQRRRGGVTTVGFLTLRDVGGAETQILLSVQRRAFSAELAALPGGGVGRRSSIVNLNPFTDDVGLLRCGGRLAAAVDLPFDTRCPVILPHTSEVVLCLVRFTHEQLLHAGVDQTLGDLRRRFWITQGRRTVSRVVNACVPCQRLFKAPQSQLMAPLPVERVTAGVVFGVTGVDCFGPYRCKIVGRAFHKVYVVLFTCLAVRAVHFEVLRDMSASCFLDAFQRFRARRPGVRRLWSDCGSNFVAAAKDLKAEVEAWNSSTSRELQVFGVEWTFNPPAAAHRGGVWERLIRSAKRHLSFLVQQDNISIETLTTVLAQVEFTMNSRPITYVSGDPGCERALTPMDFLCPGVVSHSFDDILPLSPPDAEVLRYSWHQSRALVDGFWRRWSRDYVAALQARPKWRQEEANLKVGDVVMLVDEQVRRCDWRTGVVVATDGGELVRSVDVRVPGGKTFSRDRTKVVRLELDPLRARPL